MRAAWYERPGAAPDVLVVDEMEDPEPASDEVRVRVHFSCVNPGDVKKRQDFFGVGMRFPRVIPHSDGAGVVDKVGESVSSSWIGRRVWCFGAQSGRPFGTAAEFTVLPQIRVVPLDESIPLERAAGLGIPGITGHRAVHAADAISGATVLVQGGAGAVGSCAVQLAHRAGARVLATVRRSDQMQAVRRAGADEVLLTGDDLVERIRSLAPEGVDHIVEVAFGANVDVDVAVLKEGGSVAAYASDTFNPRLPFWRLVFRNARVFFLGSDDFSEDEKRQAGEDLNRALEDGWEGLPVEKRLPLEQIAKAHELVEHSSPRGRILLNLLDADEGRA